MTNIFRQSTPLLFFTDGGLETDMIFKRGLSLPQFAAIVLLRTAEGRVELERYYRAYLELAKRVGTGFELVSATWRASPGWAPALGLSEAELDGLNKEAVDILLKLRAEYQSAFLPVVVTGCVGPRGDGYEAGKLMSAAGAQAYHSQQIATLVGAGADLISAMTMTNVSEAIGIVRAARSSECPVVVSFTVETDGRLPAGDTLSGAIAAVDQATDDYPAFYMVNCAHPDHFASALRDQSRSIGRIAGIRANASRCSHAELDAMTELDEGDPVELGQLYRAAKVRLPHLTLLGGCCGTDIRHIEAIAAACLEPDPVS